MEDISCELSDAFERAVRYRRANTMLSQLRTDAAALERTKRELENRLEKEIDDAQKMEMGGVSVAISKLLGTHEAQLDQARANRYTAKRRHEEAVYGLEMVRRRIAELEAERISLEGCEESYAALYEQKTHMLMHSGSNTESRMVALIEEIEQIKANLEKIDGAAAAGQRVSLLLQDIYHELMDADNAYGRGGMFVRMEAIDDAKNVEQETKSALDRFNAELADICVIPGASEEKGNAPRFAEVFFDELIIDWLKANRIERSLDNVKKAKADVHIVLERLKSKAESEQTRLRSLEDELLVLVMGA